MLRVRLIGHEDIGASLLQLIRVGQVLVFVTLVLRHDFQPVHDLLLGIGHEALVGASLHQTEVQQV